jgi:hypothetical protein
MSLSEGSRTYPDHRVVLPPLGEVGRNDGQYPQDRAQMTLPAMQSSPFSHSGYHTYPPPAQSMHPLHYSEEHPNENPTHLIRQQDQPVKFSSTTSPFEFVAGSSQSKTPDLEFRQARKIGQRRDLPDERYRVDRKPDPSAPRLYVQNKPIIRAVPSKDTLSRTTLREQASASRQLESEPREKRRIPAAQSKAKELKSRGKASLLPISDLIRNDSRYEISSPFLLMRTYTICRPDPIYSISMRQQPIAARACGFGERDRRVIDPPPILELKIEEPGASADELRQRLRYPYYVVHCSLWNADHDKDNSAMDDVGDRRNQQRRLMGTLVASPFVGKDENNEEGCFFCFPDLSCRTTGRYRLKFVFLLLDPNTMKPGTKVPFSSTIISDVVQVYAAKDFPGMQSSTQLTRRLKEQGCLISVKKGIEKIGEKSSSTRGRDDSEEDDGEHEGSDSARGKRYKN